ncbi:hypothetical protein V8C26DRAFT_398937 [Trichoderma gracile]
MTAPSSLWLPFGSMLATNKLGSAARIKSLKVPSGNQASGLLCALLPKPAKGACAIITLVPGGSSSKSEGQPGLFSGLVLSSRSRTHLSTSVLVLVGEQARKQANGFKSSWRQHESWSLPSRAVSLLQPDR